MTMLDRKLLCFLYETWWSSIIKLQIVLRERLNSICFLLKLDKISFNSRVLGE